MNAVTTRKVLALLAIILSLSLTTGIFTSVPGLVVLGVADLFLGVALIL